MRFLRLPFVFENAPESGASGGGGNQGEQPPAQQPAPLSIPTPPGAAQPQARSYTQAELDAYLANQIAERERQAAEKARQEQLTREQRFEEQLQAQRNEIAAIQQQRQQEQYNAGLAAYRRDVLDSLSGVSPHLLQFLQGDTYEAIQASAQRIADSHNAMVRDQQAQQQARASQTPQERKVDVPSAAAGQPGGIPGGSFAAPHGMPSGQINGVGQAPFDPSQVHAVTGRDAVASGQYQAQREALMRSLGINTAGGQTVGGLPGMGRPSNVIPLHQQQGAPQRLPNGYNPPPAPQQYQQPQYAGQTQGYNPPPAFNPQQGQQPGGYQPPPPPPPQHAAPAASPEGTPAPALMTVSVPIPGSQTGERFDPQRAAQEAARVRSGERVIPVGEQLQGNYNRSLAEQREFANNTGKPMTHDLGRQEFNKRFAAG